MFRHSEIQALLRDRRHAAEAGGDEAEAAKASPVSDVEEGEVEDDAVEHHSAPSRVIAASRTNRPLSNKARKAEKAKQKGYFKQNVKPDLRKRTWDKVDIGLGTLAYDDDDGSTSKPTPSAPQRRRISYDDD